MIKQSNSNNSSENKNMNDSILQQSQKLYPSQTQNIKSQEINNVEPKLNKIYFQKSKNNKPDII